MKKMLLLCTGVASLLSAGSALSCKADNGPDGKAPVKSESLSFIVLGDVHYCDASFYDLEAMLCDKPGDHRQITGTYAPVTAANWTDQVRALKERIDRTKPPVGCVVQLGDISEGISNRAGGAEKMAENMMNVLRRSNLGVPWILTKGNHDVTGFGPCREEARSAFGKYYTPFIREQTGGPVEGDANYTYRMGEVLIVVLDAYDNKVDQTDFLRRALENTTARYKFVCMHEPAIPASERCWHYLRNKPQSVRDEFLKVLAQNRAIFLCGHLHRYSVLRRDTEWGPIVQVMTTSVTNLRRSSKPTYRLDTDRYGEGLVDWKAEWNPATAESRRAVLREEARHVHYYEMNNLAGYALIEVDTRRERILLRYYPAFEERPYEEIDLTELYNRK